MSGSKSRTISKEVECPTYTKQKTQTSSQTEVAANNNNNDNSTVWTRLQDLQHLKTTAVITPAEYEERKAQLVDELTGTCINPKERKKLRESNNEKNQKLHSSKSKKEASIPRPPPDWATLPSEEAVLHTYSLDTNSWSNTKVTIQIEATPFARGTLRYAYHLNGLATFGTDSSTCYVAKMSIDPYEERESYFEDVKMQTLCKQYADEYNNYKPPKTVDFIKAWLLELPSRTDSPLAGVERFIHGPYRKHNNNFGFVSDEERNTPQAFSHFTYEASKHELLICDIQGVADCYTDPQIHNHDGRGFGKGNMGQRGFNKFLSTHRCNAICRYLKLPLINAKVNDLGTIPAQQLMAYTKVQVTHIRYQSEVVGLPKFRTPRVDAAVEEEEPQAASTECCCTIS